MTLLLFSSLPFSLSPHLSLDRVAANLHSLSPLIFIHCPANLHSLSCNIFTAVLSFPSHFLIQLQQIYTLSLSLSSSAAQQICTLKSAANLHFLSCSIFLSRLSPAAAAPSLLSRICHLPSRGVSPGSVIYFV